MARNQSVAEAESLSRLVPTKGIEDIWAMLSALLAGRWSLLDYTDTDGMRYALLMENCPRRPESEPVEAIDVDSIAGGSTATRVKIPDAGDEPTTTEWIGSGGATYDVYILIARTGAAIHRVVTIITVRSTRRFSTRRTVTPSSRPRQVNTPDSEPALSHVVGSCG